MLTRYTCTTSQNAVRPEHAANTDLGEVESHGHTSATRKPIAIGGKLLVSLRHGVRSELVCKFKIVLSLTLKVDLSKCEWITYSRLLRVEKVVHRDFNTRHADTETAQLTTQRPLLTALRVAFLHFFIVSPIMRLVSDSAASMFKLRLCGVSLLRCRQA